MAEYKRYSKEYYRAIAEILERDDFANIPANEEIKGTHTFSESFKKRMQKLIDSFDRPRKISPALLRIILVAAIILAIILGSFSVSSIKSPIIEFLQSVSPDHTTAQFVDIDSSGNVANDNPTYLETIYEPTYMTEGYERVSTDSDLSLHKICYEDKEQNRITFSQQVFSAVIDINTEDVSMNSTELDGITLYYCYKNGNYRVYWNQNGYSFSLLFCSSLEESFKIIQSLEEK